MRLLLLPTLVALSLSGCSTAPESDGPREATVQFYDAIRDDRGRDACALVSDPTVEQLESQESSACRDAITELDHEGGTVANVHVFITSAKVDLTSGESVFLDKGPDGWKLSAIACKVEEGKPRDRPLDCEVEA